MTPDQKLRDLGLFDARVPRYTSYPPANHFNSSVTEDAVQGWMRDLPAGAKVSLYVHIPYCRRLCWFCACRTQGTATDRPLVPYLAALEAELALLDAHLPKDITIGQIHLGGGTPTLLGPELIERLSRRLKALRPLADDLSFSVEIDPTEVDAARIEALAAAGMTRASLGVQDFDPEVQKAIGRAQPYDVTRDVVEMLREAGITSLNLDLLYGLPHQTRARMVETVQQVLTLAPDRIALYGYAHVPWMAKRQVMIPAEALPDAEARLELFEAARRLFVWDGYAPIGIDHFARNGDSMATAARRGRLRRNFQGYTVDDSTALIGLGASAISKYPQGYAQNAATSSRYIAATEAGKLPAARGHALSRDDQIRAAMIESVMCEFELDLPALSAAIGEPLCALRARCAPILERFGDMISDEGNVLRITSSARLLARLVAQALDGYVAEEGRHSRAM